MQPIWAQLTSFGNSQVMVRQTEIPMECDKEQDM